MKNIRLKKMKTQQSQASNGAFDQSLIIIQIQRNDKCIQQINKNNMEKAHDILKLIKKDLQMITSANKEKKIIKALSLNTEAFFYQKQKQYQKSLQCLNEASAIQIANQHDQVDRARTLLNKCVIFSLLNKHQEAIAIAKEALELLKRKKEIGVGLKKNQYKVYQIMVVSFYNIAVQLSHLNEEIQAYKIYKEGYSMSQKVLGGNHKLTNLLKNLLKTYKNKHKKIQSSSQDKNGSMASDIQSNANRSFKAASLHQKFKDLSSNMNQRQKQLKKIYLNKYSTSSLHPEKQTLHNQDEISYLKSLERIKALYNKDERKNETKRSNRNSRTTSKANESENINQSLKDNRHPKTKKPPKTQHTEQMGDRYRYDEQPLEHQRARDIILSSYNKLNSKRSNYMNFLTEDEKKQVEITNQKNYKAYLEQKKMEPVEKLPVINEKPHPGKIQKQESACSLI